MKRPCRPVKITAKRSSREGWFSLSKESGKKLNSKLAGLAVLDISDDVDDSGLALGAAVEATSEHVYYLSDGRVITSLGLDV